MTRACALALVLGLGSLAPFAGCAAPGGEPPRAEERAAGGEELAIVVDGME